MIEISRNHHASPDADIRIKIIGLGGAGSNALDRIMLDGLECAELVAINTDVQSLTSSVASHKVQLGRSTTRGLGAGGDPEVGYEAAQEGVDEVRDALEDAQLIFLCVGLGGGTGSGAAPLVAHLAREQGALVIVIATVPFSFEGRRRMAQAEEALGALQHYADVVICFENDKMAEAVSPRAGIQEAFAAADQTISQSVRAIALLVQRPGLVRVGFDELRTAMQAQNARCLFGFGEAEDDNRAHTALERALRSPLMDRGRLLQDAQNLLVHIVGGPSMTLNEVQILMEELNRHVSDSTRILFGTGVDPRAGNRMTVMILSALAAETSAKTPAPRTALPEPLPKAAKPAELAVHPVAPAAVNGADAREEAPVAEIAPAPPPPKTGAPLALPAPEPEPSPATSPPVSKPVTRPAKAVAPAAQEQKPREAKQEQMSFEPVTRGRFEKSEPTIVDGEDLDVPAFLRRNIRVK